MKEIPLSQKGKNRGKYVALVDDDMYDELMKYRWAYSRGYAVHKVSKPGERCHLLRMHRMIIDTPEGMDTDHVNGNGLDNRRCNLRVCTTSQNVMNKRIQSNNTSGVCGVTWHKAGRKWTSQIKVNQHQIYLGIFADKAEAIKVRNEAAHQYFGEFARV